MHRGYVKDWRKSSESSLYWDVHVWHLFMHIVKGAAWKASNGLSRGECRLSYKALAEAYGVDKSTICRWVQKLQRENMITCRNDATGRIVATVCNYTTYQDEEVIAATLMQRERNGDATLMQRERNGGCDEDLPQLLTDNGLVESGTDIALKKEKKVSIKEGKKEEGAATPPVGESLPAKVKPEEIAIPGELDTPEFRAARDAWFRQRRSKRLSLRPEYVTGQFARLLPLGSANAAACLLDTVANDYDGVFPKKFINGPPNGKPSQPSRVGGGQRFKAT